MCIYIYVGSSQNCRHFFFAIAVRYRPIGLCKQQTPTQKMDPQFMQTATSISFMTAFLEHIVESSKLPQRVQVPQDRGIRAQTLYPECFFMFCYSDPLGK